MKIMNNAGDPPVNNPESSSNEKLPATRRPQRTEGTTKKYTKAQAPKVQAQKPNYRAEQASAQAQRPNLFAEQAPGDTSSDLENFSENHARRHIISAQKLDELELISTLFEKIPGKLKFYVNFILHQQGKSRRRLPLLSKPATAPELLKNRLSGNGNLIAALSYSLRQQLMICCQSPLHLLCELSKDQPGLIFCEIKRRLRSLGREQFELMDYRHANQLLAVRLCAFGVSRHHAAQILHVNEKYIPDYITQFQQQINAKGTDIAGCPYSAPMYYRRDPVLLLLNTLCFNFYCIIIAELLLADTDCGHLHFARQWQEVNNVAAVGAYDCMRLILSQVNGCKTWLERSDPFQIPSFRLFYRVLHRHNLMPDSLPILRCSGHTNKRGAYDPCNSCYLPPYRLNSAAAFSYSKEPCPCRSLSTELKMIELGQLLHRGMTKDVVSFNAH